MARSRRLRDVRPTFAMNDTKNLRFGKTVSLRQRTRRRFARLITPANLPNVVLGQFGVGVLSPSDQQLRVQPRPVLVPACRRFGMRMPSVSFAKRPQFGAHPEDVLVSARIVLGMQSASALIATGHSFGVCLRPVAVAACQFFGVQARPMAIPTRLTVSPDHVGHVVGIRPLVKVVWVAAWRIVARVKRHRFRPTTGVDREREAVDSILSLANPEVPVPVLVGLPTPRPARIGTPGAVHLRPETLDVLRGKLGVHRRPPSLVHEPSAGQVCRRLFAASIIAFLARARATRFGSL